MQNAYILSLLLASVSNFILIAVILKRTQRSSVLGTFVILLVLVNTWAIPQLVLTTFQLTGDVFVAIDKISALGYVFIPVVFSLFALAYTNKLHIVMHKLYIFAVFCIALIFLYLAWNTSLIESRDYETIVKASWGYAIPTGPLFPVLVLWFESLVIFSVIHIFQLYKTTLDPLKKRQSLLLLVAMLIPLVFGTFTNGILPILGIRVFPLAIPLTSVTSILTAYAILRYGLFEVTSDAILSSIGNGVITINDQKKIVHINAVAHDLLGIGGTQVVGKALKDIVSLRREKLNKGVSNEIHPITYVLKTGKQIAYHDFLMRPRSKKQFSIECTVTPIFQLERVVGVTLIFRDTTKEKEIEKSKNEFISIASHELKTPLTSVIAFSQILEKRMAGDEDRRNLYFIQSINKQLEKMKQLVSDLLNVSRIESGMFVLNKKESAIGELVENVVHEFSQTHSTHTFLLESTVHKKLLIDADRISQVLINLLSNAVKYSPNADAVRISMHQQDRKVVISVQDYGNGIPKKDQSKVFDRFYRSKRSAKSTIVGFGLGLYICSEIIQSHNGNIWVKSRVGKGSTFSFSLPY